MLVYVILKAVMNLIAFKGILLAKSIFCILKKSRVIFLVNFI